MGFTYDFEEDNSDCIVDHALSENDGEEFGLGGGADEGEGGHWVGCRYGSAVFDDEADVHVLVGLVLADGDDPLQLVDEVGQPEDGSEGDDGAQKAEEEDVLEVPLKIFLLQIVAARKNHGWQQSVEEDLLVKGHIVDISKGVHDEPEQQANKDADAGLVDDVDLGEGGGTFRC